MTSSSPPRLRMTIAFMPPLLLSTQDWRTLQAQFPATQTYSYRELCALAGIRPRISGEDLERRIELAEAGPSARLVDSPDRLRIVASEKTLQRQALRALEVLAYGFHDYAAREAVCGRGYFVPTPPAGRPRSGRALDNATRVRRHRARKAASPAA